MYTMSRCVASDDCLGHAHLTPANANGFARAACVSVARIFPSRCSSWMYALRRCQIASLSAMFPYAASSTVPGTMPMSTIKGYWCIAVSIGELADTRELALTRFDSVAVVLAPETPELLFDDDELDPECDVRALDAFDACASVVA